MRTVCLAVLCFCRHELYISHNGCSGWQRRVLGSQVAASWLCVWPQVSHSWPHLPLGLRAQSHRDKSLLCFTPCTDSPLTLSNASNCRFLIPAQSCWSSPSTLCVKLLSSSMPQLCPIGLCLADKQPPSSHGAITVQSSAGSSLSSRAVQL